MSNYCLEPLKMLITGSSSSSRRPAGQRDSGTDGPGSGYHSVASSGWKAGRLGTPAPESGAVYTDRRFTETSLAPPSDRTGELRLLSERQRVSTAIR